MDQRPNPSGKTRTNGTATPEIDDDLEREGEVGRVCVPSDVAPALGARSRRTYRPSSSLFADPDPYAAEGPETVYLRFPLSLVRLLETFGSRFFEYSPERRAYVGRPTIAPAICKIIAGDAAKGQQLMSAVEDAYSEYIAVQSSVDQPMPKPIP